MMKYKTKVYKIFQIKKINQCHGTVALVGMVPLHIGKGAHRDKNQPVPLRGIKAFYYGAPKVCTEF